MRLLLVLASLISTLLFVSAKKSIGEILAVRFNNSNLSSIPDHPALWDLLRLPKDAISDTEIFHILGEMFDFEDNIWILKWLLEHAKSSDKEWIGLIKKKYAKSQLHHGLKVRDHKLVRSALLDHYKQSKWPMYLYYNDAEVKDYASYLLDRFEVEKESAEIIQDFHLYCKEFSAFDNLFMSPKASPKLLAGILEDIFQDSGKFLTLANGISTEDLTNVFNSKETMLKIHSRNVEVFEMVKEDLESAKSKTFLKLFKIVNDILFLPHSSHKIEKILKHIDHLDASFQKDHGFFSLGNQPFLHHSAINIDDPELFEAIEAKFPKSKSKYGNYFMIYHGPKSNCFERLSDKTLHKFFDLNAPMFRNLIASGLEKDVAFAFSRNRKFEAAEASFRLFDGGLPDAIVENERADLLMTNLKYLMDKLDVPVVRVFEFVSIYKDLLVQGPVDINPDRLFEILQYSDQKSVTKLFQMLGAKKTDLVLKNSEDDNRRLKYLNYFLDSDSGFNLLMKHRDSLLNVLSFNFAKAVDGLPIHKVRRFFNFVGARVEGCVAPETSPDYYDVHRLCNYDMKISQLNQKFDLDYDLLPFIGMGMSYNFESLAYAWSSIGKNLGLFEIWFQENPESMLLKGTRPLLQFMKHRFTPAQIEAARLKVGNDSYQLKKLNEIFL